MITHYSRQSAQSREILVLLLRVFSDQMSELATHAVDFRLYCRFGIGSERKVVLVRSDRPGGVAGERGEPALLVQEGREVTRETATNPLPRRRTARSASAKSP